APISTLRSRIDVTPWPRAMKVIAVAQPSAASTKNCHGCRPGSVSTRATLPSSVASTCERTLVEVSELIVQPLVDRGVDGFAPVGIRVPGAAATRQTHGDETDRHGASRADQVRKQPGQAVEALVERCAKHLLAAVPLHEGRDDLVARLAGFDH